MPSGEKHTPFGTFMLMEGENGLTSSATRVLARSVTAQIWVLRVPTNRMPVDGPTAMWRASGTMAYRSILKPGGSLTFFRLFRIASALAPVWGMVSILRLAPVDWKFSSFFMLSCDMAASGTERATTEATIGPLIFILSPSEF